MGSSHETIKIDYGSNFRMIHGDVYSYTKNLIKNKELSFQDIGVWFLLCNYMKPYSTEIDISISKFSKETGKSKGHVSEQINKLAKHNLIIKKNDKLYINLKFATRGNEVYEDIYRFSHADFNLRNEISMEKSDERNIRRDLEF